MMRTSPNRIEEIAASHRGQDMKKLLTPQPGEDNDFNDLMRSTTKMNFASAVKGEREQARPSSKTRHNNPQGGRNFQRRTLPSGEVITVATQDVKMTDELRQAAARETEVITSSVREDYKQPVLESWQKGNTKRFGSNSQPWANSTLAVRGIVPDVSRGAVDRMSDTTTTTQDSFSSTTDFSRFNPAGGRRAPAVVDPEAEDAINTVVRPDTADEVASWIKSAPGFEGEVVKRMMRDVAARSRGKDTGNLGATSPQPSGKEQDYKFVSKWAGPSS